MTWFDRILAAVQSAAVIGERVERLGNSVADISIELRDVDRRVSRLEGALSVAGQGSHAGATDAGSPAARSPEKHEPR